ncbi:MAG: hypothetical protein IT434_06795 [Phycisphaerales bacterium]|nr:hypothetical protein [Phycisphaerales bacterium]
MDPRRPTPSGQTGRGPGAAVLNAIAIASDARLASNASGPLDPLLAALAPAMAFVTLVAQVAKRHADLGDLEGSEAIMRALVATSPSGAGPYYGLARLVHLSGGAEEARALLERGLAYEPAHAPSLGLLASVLHYTEAGPAAVRAAHERLARHVESGVTPLPARPRTPSAWGGRLRIAYMSGDLRDHSVAWFVRSLLEHHDRERFDVWCLSTSARPSDTTTAELRTLVESRWGTWRPCAGIPDEQLASQIRADGIDIVIELSGLTEGNRLRALAMRPAPLQVTAIGYPGTTGFRSIDARIVDAVTDPIPGDQAGAESGCTEALVRLPRCFLCYTPPPDAPSPERRPGPPTFCSFNSLFKFGPRTLDLFAGVLRACPDARLILKNQLLDPPYRRARLAAAFASRGIHPARLEILGKIPGRDAHLEAYTHADVALDTSPYNGTTTT